jgi:hypothetical protein
MEQAFEGHSHLVRAKVAHLASAASAPCKMKMAPNSVPFQAILATATVEGCDLIVMGFKWLQHDRSPSPGQRDRKGSGLRNDPGALLAIAAPTLLTSSESACETECSRCRQTADNEGLKGRPDQVQPGETPLRRPENKEGDARRHH